MKQKPIKKVPLRVLITAGPTRAYLDRVRFLTNHSSGELGFLLSKELVQKSVEVVAIVGPNPQPFSQLPLKKLIQVETAQEMLEETLRMCHRFKPQVAVFSAAVLDFAPQSPQKIKVSSKTKRWVLELLPNPKVIDEVGKHFPQIQRIGFKLEWKIRKSRALNNFAQKVIKEKKLNALCINFLPLISKKKHPLWIFSERKLEGHASTKRQAAKRLAHFIQQVAKN